MLNERKCKFNLWEKTKLTHNGTCLNEKGKFHLLYWDYTNPEFSEDYESIIFNGKCENCDTEFQKTYSNPLLSIISKSTREVSNFEHLVDHLN